MVRMAMIPPSAPGHSGSAGGACSDWELVLHAFFDGELDAADSLACKLHLRQCQRCSGELKNLELIRWRLRRHAIGWTTPDALRNRIG